MSDLLREIRSAQIRAGEGAVCDHLCKLGLIAEKVADVQRPLNALKIAAALHDGACPAYVRLDAAEMIRQQHAEIEWLKRERKHIYDLLARIHRDGGQYAAEHGVEKSCDNAEAQVVTWLETISGIDSLVEQARVAEREAIENRVRALQNPHYGLTLGSVIRAIRVRSVT